MQGTSTLQRRTYWRSVGRGVALALSALVLGCASVPLEERSWLLVQTPHFEILSDADEQRSAELGQHFEDFHAFMQKMLRLEKFEPSVPTRVFLFTNRATYRNFAGSRSAGFFVGTPRANYIVIGSVGSLDETTVAFHEYSHFALRSAKWLYS